MILDAWGWCTGTTQRDGMGRGREEGSGWGTHVYLWQIHFDIWQNQYNIVKLNKIQLKKRIKKIYNMGFPYSSVGKESAWNAGDPDSIPESGRSPGEGNHNPLQYSCPKNHGQRSLVGYSPWGHKRQTRLSN